jgi:hypothetical protein
LISIGWGRDGAAATTPDKTAKSADSSCGKITINVLEETENKNLLIITLSKVKSDSFFLL